MNKATEQVFIVNAAPNQPSRSLLEVGASGSSQVNLENVEDFSHICRICATNTESVMPIFSGEGLQNNLADKIQKHLPIQVCSSDTLPLVVCYPCASTLLAWHELVQCCEQADAALRARLAAIQQKSKARTTKDTPRTEDEAESKLFYKNVKNALIEFDIDLEQGEPDVEFVCQKCSEKPALGSARSLAQHVRRQHCTVRADDVKAFITEYVTFEQALADDSDRDTQSDTRETPPVRLAQLRCPFCASVFSSATRLVHHLNRHVQVCLAAGVHCCGHSYTRPRPLAQHLQDAHVRADAPPAQPLCCSCGHCAADADQLKQHFQTAHADHNTKQKKAERPNNQKYIPAVCPECNKTFSNKYNMFAHLRAHAGPAPRLACPRCPRTFARRGALAAHARVAHAGLLPHVCPHCADAFPSRAQRDAHARLHSGAAPYACAHCRKAFRASSTLARHMEIHLAIRKYKSSCDSRQEPLRSRRHSDLSDDAPLASLAGKPKHLYDNFYRALENFRNHFVNYHHHEEYSESGDSSESSGEQAPRAGDGDVDRFDDLSACNRRRDRLDEATRRELRAAQQRVGDKTYYECGTCGKRLSSAHTYVFHRRIHTGERPCVCHVCGKQFRAPNGLQRHLTETHERVRRYACSLCANTFANSQNLKQHLRIHTGEKPFVCPHCGKRFTQSGSLHVHLKTHSQLFPFVCAECGAKFRLRSGLARHRLRHTGERPHACACGRAFRQRHELAAHAAAHSGARPHACVCGRAFRQRRALRHHARRAHPAPPC